jgi:uncharacterized membrane protein YhaH (DUF805 family)
MSATTQVNEPPLDWPYYGIGFGDAIKRFFKKYATFTGRASRGEYWWYALFSAIVTAVLYAIVLAMTLSATTAASASGETPQLGAGYYLVSSLLSLWGLATLVPGLALTVRRLHDTGRSGWYILLGLIPFVGGIVVLVLLIGTTSPAAEQYGPPRSQYAAPGYGPPGAYGQSYPQA